MAGAGDDLLASARTLFDGESFVVSDHNQVGNPIAYASPQFEALTLYTADEVIGRNVGFLMRDDTEQAGDAEARGAVSEGRSSVVTVRAYRADGSLFYAEMRHYPVRGQDGRVAYVISLVADASELAHMAAAQEVARELNASLDGDGRFFNYAMLVRDDGSVSVPWVSDTFKLVTGYEPSDLLESGFE